MVRPFLKGDYVSPVGFIAGLAVIEGGNSLMCDPNRLQ